MAMTKKHYEMVARKLLARRDDLHASHDVATAEGDAHIMSLNMAKLRENAAIARLLADEFAADDPNFDRARFLKACGMQA